MSHGRSTGDRRADFFICVLIGVGLFCFYLAVQRQIVASYDGQIMLSVARNIWSKGSIATDPAVDVFHTNTPYSTYGIGMSALLVPFVWLGGSRPDGGTWVTLVNPLILAAAGVVLFQIGRALGWARIWAVAAALAFGLLTLAPSQSTELFSEPMTTLCTVVALWGCIRWQARTGSAAPWMVGVSVGVAFLFRPDSIVLVGCILLFVPLFVSLRELGRRPSQLVGVFAPILVAGGVQAWYNTARFGSVLKFGYPTGAYGQGINAFSTPLFQGLDVLLRYPHKGFFWFNPLLLTALPGFIWLARRNRAASITIGGLALIRLLVYAKWFDPAGGIGWGPRLLFPLCATLMIPAAETWQRIARLRGAARVFLATGVVALVLLAGALTALSLWVPYEQSWYEASTLRGADTRAEVDQRVDDYHHSVRGSPILANYHLLERASRFPLRHFEGGADTTGKVAGLVAIFCCTGAGVAAVRADKRSRQPRDRARRAELTSA